MKPNISARLTSQILRIICHHMKHNIKRKKKKKIKKKKKKNKYGGTRPRPMPRKTRTPNYSLQ